MASCSSATTSAPWQDAGSAVNPSGGALFALPTTRPPDLARSGLTTWLGEARVTDVRRQVAAVRRVGLILSDGRMFVGRHEPALTLEGVTILQVQRSLRLVNERTPKLRYAT